MTPASSSMDTLDAVAWKGEGLADTYWRKRRAAAGTAGPRCRATDDMEEGGNQCVEVSRESINPPRFEGAAAAEEEVWRKAPRSFEGR